LVHRRIIFRDDFARARWHFARSCGNRCPRATTRSANTADRCPLRICPSIFGSYGVAIVVYLADSLNGGLYAEERKRGTLELLATSPITNWAVAVGKLLGVLTFFTTMVIPMLVLEAIAISGSNPAMAFSIPLLGHFGLILLAAAILSVGMFISSLTDSTILSAVFTFAVILLLLLIDLIAKIVPGPVGEALGYLSLLKHYNTLIQGIFDTSALILFASYIFLGIFLTAQSIDALRFQRQ
jgi:ABC-2 type transport system permease protein